MKKLLTFCFILLICCFSFSQTSPAIDWQLTIGGSANDNCRHGSRTTDSGYILAGDSQSGIGGDKTEASAGFEDLWVIKLDPAGAIEWQNTIGGSGFDFLESIAQTTDGGYILGGQSTSHAGGDKTDNSHSYDYWIVKLDAAGALEW